MLEADFRSLGHPVDTDGSDSRIDYYLASRFPFRSRPVWKKLIGSRQVRVNERIIRASYRLRQGDKISYYCPASEEPDVNRDLEIVFRHADFAAVAKPSNLPMHEGGAYRANTFAAILQDRLGPGWAAVHRLDRETSGLVLCSPSPEVRRVLSEVIHGREITKEYFAIVSGVPQDSSWVVDVPIGIIPSDGIVRERRGVTPLGRSSRTLFSVVATSRSGFSLLKAVPVTGRTHQIRIHAAHSGFSLLGDKHYAQDPTIYPEFLQHGFSRRVEKACLVDRLCLHAAKLSFTYPPTGEQIKISMELAQDLQEIWSWCSGLDLNQHGVAPTSPSS